MANAIDIVGNKYGYLTVIERLENNNRCNTMWKCKCECGGEKVALGYDLTHGRTVECGCGISKRNIPSKKRVDLTGGKFGDLTVVGMNDQKGARGALRWDCKCSCGGTITVQGGNLKSGKTLHCGCKKSVHSNNFMNLSGTKRGMLMVIDELKTVDKRTYWRCACDCGNIVIKTGVYLRKTENPTCGCIYKAKPIKMRPKIFNKRSRTHGMSKKRIYKEWNSMRMRCKPSYYSRKNYYDKGISVCKEWDRFEVFAEWALNNGYSDDLTIDRIDNSKGYCPENCRWVTNKTQQNNKTTNVYITIDGETKTMKQWCELYEISYGAVRQRRKYGWAEEDLFLPVGSVRKYQRCG